MSAILVLPAVAKSLPYPCKKCEGEKYHRVLAHTSSTTAKIQCEICGSKKTLNILTKKAAPAKKTTVATKKSASKSLAPSVWSDLQQKIGSQGATTYSFKTTYQTHQAIEHAQFGIGFVTKVQGQKIEVVFQDQVRQLVHGR